MSLNIGDVGSLNSVLIKARIPYFSVSGGKGVILDGHHLTYVRLGEELRTDIQIVCRGCHKKIHGH